MGRLIIALNWTLGSLALAVALLVPTIDQRLVVDPARDEALGLVNDVIDAQTRYFEIHDAYVPFHTLADGAEEAILRLGLDAAAFGEARFVLVAAGDEDAALTVRAISGADALVEGRAPALVVSRSIPRPGAAATAAEWEALSNRRPGLFQGLGL